MTSPPIHWTALVVTASLLPLLSFVAAEPNPEHRGENGTCLDFNALFLTSALQSESIPVEGGTSYNASFEGGRSLYIDFYDESGELVGDNARDPRTTPVTATRATLCVGTNGGGWPDLPAPDATWTYQDGL